MKVILINGPPGAGKDTAAHAIRHHHRVSRDIIIDRMSMPIKRAFAGFMGLQCDPLGNVKPYEAQKDTIIDLLGVSYRDWQISFSEDFVKPLFGAATFGELLWTRISKYESIDTLVLVPDCGFQVEVDVIRRHMKQDQIFLLRLDRSGCEWDSRGEVYAPGCSTVILVNATDLETFESRVIDATKSWIGPP